jgi:hypothetical protein
MIKKWLDLFRGEKFMLWMVVAMAFLTFSHSIDSEINAAVFYAAQTGYIFCIVMFMCSMNKRQTERMASIELMSMDFLQDCRNRGQGKFRYFVPYTYQQRTKRWYAKLFKKTYLRVYETQFFDDGDTSMNSHKIVPVSNKQLFEMKLKGMVNTDNHNRAKQALDYLGVAWPIP